MGWAMIIPRSPRTTQNEKKFWVRSKKFLIFFTFLKPLYEPILFPFSGHEPIYFIENKEKTLRASYDRGTQIFDYME